MPVIEEELEEEADTSLAETNDPEEYVTFKRSHFYSVLVVLAFAVGLLLGYVLWGRGTTVTAAAPSQETANQPSGPVQEAPVTAQPQYTRYDIPTEGYPSLGPADAPITIVEFSDFQCPFCRRFHQETYSALLNAYPGQIRFVYRNLPLTSIHPNAMSAAIASLCANDQNVYWDYHDKLFSSETLSRDIYIQYASELGVNVDDFSACLDSGAHDDYIAQDMDFALNLGVQSTPTFFVNGLAVVGAQPLDTFQQIIDKELAGEIP
ncbi:MAG TPA: DsbA family protein [Anaerolineales bacterium]|nr:DsbA family protein [Anaerolineales bacterium]HNA89147.1 DsbA family protein [Anaerolineales bacterium]HNB36832.1 DsbA family protein [Anaerolineales bacterium]